MEQTQGGKGVLLNSYRYLREAKVSIMGASLQEKKNSASDFLNKPINLKIIQYEFINLKVYHYESMIKQQISNKKLFSYK